MLKYTIKRLLESLVTVLIIVTIVFLLLRLLPTDYYFTSRPMQTHLHRWQRRMACLRIQKSRSRNSCWQLDFWTRFQNS